MFIGVRRAAIGRTALFAAIALVGTANSAKGSAFAIAELGARAAGMATAFTAVANDGSALFYNPAGIAFLSGTRMQMDSLVVVGLFRFQPTDAPPGQVTPDKGFAGSIKPKFIPVASMYMTKELSPKLTFGFGLFTPFGLSANFTNFNDGDPALTKYPGRWAGTRARLESFWFQPTFAYKIRPNQSIAIGPAFVHTHLMLEQSILNPLDDGLEFGREAANTVFPGVDKELAARSIARMLPEGRSRVAGTANSAAFAAGYLFKHEKSGTNIGLAFRSAVTNHLRGKASFAFGDNYTLKTFVGEDLLFKAFPNQNITGSFTTPATYSAGIANSRMFGGLLSFDFRMQDFRRFASVPLNFSVTRAQDDSVRTPAERRLVFDFRNSYIVATGYERKLNSRMTFRTGYYFDRSPVVDKSVGPLFPDANRNNLTFGASMRRGTREFTVFYQMMDFRERNIQVPLNAKLGTNGNYLNFAHLFGIGLRTGVKENE